MRRGFAALFLCAVIGLAQPAVPEAVQAQVAHFFKLLAAGEVERAYARLLEGGPLADSVQQAQLVEQTYRLHERYGLPLGYELARMTAYGKSLLRLAYVGLYGQQAVVWRMHFYRSPRHGWIAIRVVVSDSVEELQ
ncbi:MAG: hypothetical protein ABDH31_03780 [Chlorobiota bacterium]